jgi:hypothetical protein
VLLGVNAQPSSLNEANATIGALGDQLYCVYKWQAEGQALWHQAGQGPGVHQPPASPLVQNMNSWADAYPAELSGTSLVRGEVAVVTIIVGQLRYFTPEACQIVSGLSKEIVGKKVGAVASALRSA